MDNGVMVIIPRKEYETLIRAEFEAYHLKSLLRLKHDNYSGLTFEEVKMLYKLYPVRKMDESEGE